MDEVRSLNENGTQLFSDYLDRIRAGASENPPSQILTDTSTSVSVPGGAALEKKKFANRMEAAKYFYASLHDKVDRQYVDHNSGLWSWLALYYFEQLCPAPARGARHPGQKYRYILPKIESEDHFRHYYRHLLAGPYRIYSLNIDSTHQGRLLLYPSIEKHGDFSEQLASRMELITNPGVMEAVDLLYFDTAHDAPKRGATSRKNPGNLRRLITIIQQLDLTYDLYSLTGKQILGLLPKEFDSWAHTRSRRKRRK